MIYWQGAEPVCFYYLLRGSVRSYISFPSGEERVLTIHHAGDLMGEASFFDECPRVTSAMALEPCQVVAVDRQQLNAVFARHPELALPMLQYLARTVRLLSAHVDSAARPSEQRIARHLLEQSGGKPGPVMCTQETIGQAVGASRVTVSRALRDLAAEGIIRTGYGCVELIDPKKLASRCGQ
jgi:CRP/FNR family transcriptional regulator